MGRAHGRGRVYTSYQLETPRSLDEIRVVRLRKTKYMCESRRLGSRMIHRSFFVDSNNPCGEGGKLPTWCFVPVDNYQSKKYGK